jgi:hypothetical protein
MFFALPCIVALSYIEFERFVLDENYVLYLFVESVESVNQVLSVHFVAFEFIHLFHVFFVHLNG